MKIHNTIGRNSSTISWRLKNFKPGITRSNAHRTFATEICAPRWFWTTSSSQLRKNHQAPPSTWRSTNYTTNLLFLFTPLFSFLRELASQLICSSSNYSTEGIFQKPNHLYSTLKTLSSTQIKFFTANPFYDLTRTNLQLHSSFKHIIFFRNKFLYYIIIPKKDTKRKMICQVLPLEQKYDDVTTKVVWERLIVVDKCSRGNGVFLGHTMLKVRFLSKK